MTAPPRILLAWSGGKDSALALHRLREERAYDVVGLLTTVSATTGRVSHHGVAVELVQAQADALGLPLTRVPLPVGAPGEPADPHALDAAMERALAPHRAAGLAGVAHGDLFLEELRAYRERRLAEAGLVGVFPLWGMASAAVVEEFLARGFRAKLCAVEAVLGAAFAGADLDAATLARFPPGVDLAGENGEYHSFTWDGPTFRRPVPVRIARVTTSGAGRAHAELAPA